MPVLLRKNAIVAAAFEAVEGTSVSITSTDVRFLVSDVEFRPDTTPIPRNMIGPSFARKRTLMTNKLARVTFKSEVVGSGVETTEPAWAVLIKGCGFKRTIQASAVDYDPVTNPAFDATGANGGGSLTIWVYEDGVVKKMRGARGTVKIVGDSAGLAHFEWEFLGVYDSSADASYPLLHSSYDSSIPPIVESASFVLQSVSYKIKTFTIDIGNSIVPRYNASSVSGIQNIFINDREVKGTIDPEQELISVIDSIGQYNAAAVGNFSLTIGTAAGNRVQITSPASYCQVTGITESDRDNILINNIDLAFNIPDIESSTDKEIRIIHK